MRSSGSSFCTSDDQWTSKAAFVSVSFNRLVVTILCWIYTHHSKDHTSLGLLTDGYARLPPSKPISNTSTLMADWISWPPTKLLPSCFFQSPMKNPVDLISNKEAFKKGKNEFVVLAPLRQLLDVRSLRTI
jgi:hypothetical protein